MGTNFYWIENQCPHCGRGEKIHIGKRSAGWRFSFQGYPDHQPPIRAWSDWQSILNEGTIMDEYGVTHSKSAFVAMVDASMAESRNHVPWCLADTSRGSAGNSAYMTDALTRGTAWQDPEGWSFSSTDFS